MSIVAWIGAGLGLAFVLLAVQVYLRRPCRKPLDLDWGWFTPIEIHRVCARCGRAGRRAEPADLADVLARRELPPHLCKRCVKEIQGQTRAGGSPRPARSLRLRKAGTPPNPR